MTRAVTHHTSVHQHHFPRYNSIPSNNFGSELRTAKTQRLDVLQKLSVTFTLTLLAGSCDDGCDRRESVVTDVYSTLYTFPRDTRQPIAPELHRTPSMNGDQDEEDAYYSLAGGDTESESKREHEGDPGGTGGQEAAMREIERRACSRPLVWSSVHSHPARPHPDHRGQAKAHEHVPVASAPTPSVATRSKSGSSSSSVGEHSEFAG